MVTMGTQDLLTRCPAPSERRSPPRDQKEDVGAARPADRPSFSGAGGGAAAAGQQHSRAVRLLQALRAPRRGGARLSAAGGGQDGRTVAWGRRRRRRPAAWRALLPQRPGVGAASPEGPLWPLLHSPAGNTWPRGRSRAACGRLGAPGARTRTPCAFPRLPAGHQPAIDSRGRELVDDRPNRQKSSKNEGKKQSVVAGGNAAGKTRWIGVRNLLTVPPV